MNNIKKFPAPWTLAGYGYIVLFKAKPAWLLENGFINSEMQDRYIPSIGAAMLVNYQDSTAGPYGELLFIPGKFRFPEGARYSITKIYVSTMESVVNGRENWGIPKEMADFEFTLQEDGSEHVRVSLAGQTIAACHLREGRFSLPVTTSILPGKLCSVAQFGEGKVFYTSPQAHSRLKMAKIEKIEIDSRLFPDLNQVKVLGVFKADKMAMQFPPARSITPSSDLK